MGHGFQVWKFLHPLGWKKHPLKLVIFVGFFYPWHEEISLPETRSIRKSYTYLLFYLIYFNICKNVSACLNGHGDVLSYLMTELTDLKENVFDLVNMKNQTPLHLAAASPSAGKLCLLMYAGLWSYYLSCKILKCFFDIVFDLYQHQKILLILDL